jgi:hypothetical protein
VAIFICRRNVLTLPGPTQLTKHPLNARLTRVRPVCRGIVVTETQAAASYVSP